MLCVFRPAQEGEETIIVLYIRSIPPRDGTDQARVRPVVTVLQ